MPYLLAGQSLATIISIMGIASPPTVLASYTILLYSSQEIVSSATALTSTSTSLLSSFSCDIKANLYYRNKNPFSLRSAALKISRSQILGTIASHSGLSSPTITVCDLSGKCLSYQGEGPPKSAASLIKVPIAVVLLHKLSKDNISLERDIYVDRSNFTEEDYSLIKVEKSYSFKYLLTEMIANSSNIATNQIIDYLGWNYINQVLNSLGYRTTRVAYKLTGEFTPPTRNRGFASNLITSNELSAMMVQIYNCEYPEYKVLIDIFNQQVDRLLGFEALKTSPGRWLGEKTGENTKVRGATLAAEINGKTYIITVTEDHGKSSPQIRDCIAKIVDYIDKNGGI